ncbi:MAG: hypothetical protein LCI03_07750 [Actinobacteria bacterium]|jgi:hypothetical protein|nr:hypothetical protein [Actinomycetota bacterium]
MRSTTKLPAGTPTSGTPAPRRVVKERRRLADLDAARDHLAQRGNDQAAAVARRTYAFWR